MSGTNCPSRNGTSVDLFPIGDDLEEYLDELDRILGLDSQRENPELRVQKSLYLQALTSLSEAQEELIVHKGEYIRLKALRSVENFVRDMEGLHVVSVSQPFYREHSRLDPPDWLDVSAKRWRSCLESGNRDIILDRDLDSILSELCSRDIPSSWEYYRPELEAQLWDDFKRPFLGTGAIDLQNHIKEQSGRVREWPERCPAVCPVIQSSGTGKTRTVLRLGEIEPGILICVRDAEEPWSLSSLPRRDEVACEWLKTEPHRGSLSHMNITAWLIALAEEMTRFYRQELDGADKSNLWSQLKVSFAKRLAPAVPPQMPPSDNASEETILAWRLQKQQRQERRDMFDRIGDRAAEILEEAPFSEPFPWQRSAEDIVSRIVPRLKEAFLSLQEVLDPHWDDEAFFHLAIDQAGALGGDLYALRRIWAALKMPRFWLLLLDTTPQILEIGPPDAHGEPRLCEIGAFSEILPFYNLPGNLGLIGNDTYQRVLRGEASLSHSELVTLLPLMGRPLLGDGLLRGGALEYGEVSLYLILKKLIGPDPARTWAHDDEYTGILDSNAIATLVGQRIPIRFRGTYSGASRRFAQGLVLQHMRILDDVCPAGLIKTSVPSEPLLSLATTAFFRDKPVVWWTQALDGILARCSRRHNRINLGDGAKAYARALLSMSTDFAAVRPHTLPVLPEHLQPIRLLDLLSVLLGDVRPFDGAEDYWVNFTHYLRLPAPEDKESLLPLGIVAEAYTRQAAILHTDGAHILVPCFMHADGPPIDAVPFNRDKLSFFVVQVKNRLGPRTPSCEGEGGQVRTPWLEDLSRCKVEAVGHGLRVFQLCVELGISDADIQVNSDDAGLLKIRASGSEEDTFPVLSTLKDRNRSALSEFKQWVTEENRSSEREFEFLLDAEDRLFTRDIFTSRYEPVETIETVASETARSPEK